MVLEHDRAAVEIQQALLLELGQRQRDRLSRRADQVRHLLMGDLQADLGAVLAVDAVLLAELQRQGRALGLDATRSMVRIAVTDSGSGIPAEALPRVFDPLYWTKPRTEGSGSRSRSRSCSSLSSASADA
jgi:C4-dicarboxylate-specific signal transduction histidine kinase